jgi:hypothetical protein
VSGEEPEFFPDVTSILVPADGYDPRAIRYRYGNLWFINRTSTFIHSVKKMTGEGLPITSSPTFSTSGGAAVNGFDISPDEQYAYFASGTVIRKLHIPSGTLTDLAGSFFGFQGHVDGPGSSARFEFCTDIMFGPGGLLYVADWPNDAIRTVHPDTGVVGTWHTGISSLSVFWHENGNLYRDDQANGGMYVHYSEDLSNPRLRNNGGIGGATSNNIVASAPGIIYYENLQQMLAAQTLDMAFHDAGGGPGQLKTYASALGSTSIASSNGKTYNRILGTNGWLAIREDDGDDNLFPMATSTRGVGNLVDTSTRVQKLSITPTQVNPFGTYEGGFHVGRNAYSVVDTISGSAPEITGPPYDGVYDAGTDSGGVHTTLDDIEFDGAKLWISDAARGLRTLTTTAPFQLTTVRSDLTGYLLSVDSQGKLYALKYSTWSAPCPLYEVDIDTGVTTLINTVPALQSPGNTSLATGFTYQEDQDVWWAWEYRDTVFTNSGNPGFVLKPLKLIRIPRSGSPTSHSITQTGGGASGGAGSFLASPKSLVVHNGALLFFEAMTGKIWSINLSTFVATRFIGALSSDVQSTSGHYHHPDSTLDWHIWDDAKLFKSSYVNDDRVYVMDTVPDGTAIDRIDFENDRILAYAGTANAWRAGEYVNGLALAAEFNSPADMTIDDQGYGYVADTGNKRIRRISPGSFTARGVGISLDSSSRINKRRH